MKIVHDKLKQGESGRLIPVHAKQPAMLLQIAFHVLVRKVHFIDAREKSRAERLLDPVHIYRLDVRVFTDPQHHRIGVVCTAQRTEIKCQAKHLLHFELVTFIGEQHRRTQRQVFHRG